MARGSDERQGIRLRHVVEFGFIAVFAYLAVQVGPVLVLRARFLDEIEIAANSPVQMSAAEIKQKILSIADGAGVVLLSENLHVERNQELQVTRVEARYQLHINFWPGMNYVWDLHDVVEALLY